jgi:hypothetical protein
LSVKVIVEGFERTYTGMAFGLTLFCGLLTIMVERFLYKRRGYEREATISAFIGWTYVLGGTLVYLTLWILRQWL